ncbi:30S ribosomal protein S16 [Mycoplasmopsis gallinacea]|uniref:Small ribosomal subunit protein bS16 n=1 Tax=Mycoplasmopsis gallinacea TaxID=29556 RepID=A0A0D5ZK21_9BACT|nr:30S ribosomal protein S16 [Mycoplasmopsis gallinacea]AKA49990.1 30S ribosomal protein S16 [Mycoplasmopsis gallinacea]QIW61908.1 30S ribosomal protein S16 [Mycoplasmopsis gallinacea]VEU58537.1 ribosomal protein S16 [Mycoplasmopsis gallinacea]
MVKIRLKRMGSKFSPVYKIVAADARAPRDGKFIEALGHYNPLNDEVVLNKEQILKWLSQGAQPTATVANLFKAHKLTSELKK